MKRGVIARNPSDLLPDIQEGEPPREVYSPEELASILATAQRLRADAVAGPGSILRDPSTGTFPLVLGGYRHERKSGEGSSW